MFKINDIVQVKPGIKDPDDNKTDLSGWQGRIFSINSDNPEDIIFGIEWDSETLKQMPVEYIEVSEEEGFDYTQMYLGIADLLPATQRGTEADRLAVVDQLEDEYMWADMGDQGKRIKAVVDSCENDDDLVQTWFEYLEDNIKLPLKATFIGDSMHQLHHGAEVIIYGIEDANDVYGVIGAATYQKRRIQVPLCDIEILEPDATNQALSDYIVWFANS
jgi:Calcium binding